MKKLQTLFFILGLAGSVFAFQPTALAATGLVDKSCTAAGTKICDDGGDVKGMTQKLINGLLSVLGAIAVIVIVIGGIRYVTSDGDPGKIKSAKDVILYAVVGLIIAILSYAIVNFILERFK